MGLQTFLRVLFLSLISIIRSGAVEYEGVNLSGAEWGYVGGTYGQDYVYPTQTEVDYYLSKGMNTFRVPFKWERLQPTLGDAFDPVEWGHLQTFIAETTAKGASVIIEPHNYGYYYTNYNSSAIGSASVPTTQFDDLWTRLATAYKGNNRVIFNLMNEPTMPATETWFTAAQSAITAIRATGASNLTLVPGNGYTGAWSWVTNSWYGKSNASIMGAINDPANNFAFEVHQYLDGNHAGQSSEIAYDPVSDLSPITNWLRQTGNRAFLGEFAVAPGASQTTALNGLLGFVEANADVWNGWAWWGGGPKFDAQYLFKLDPTNGVDAPQMATLSTYLAVPEPAALPLLGLAALVLLSYPLACTVRSFTSPIGSSSASSATRRKPSVASVNATSRLPS